MSTADSYTSDAALSSGYAFTDEESLPLTGGQNNAENRPPSAQDVPAGLYLFSGILLKMVLFWFFCFMFMVFC